MKKRKQILTIVLICGCILTSLAQTIKKEYYNEWTKTQIKAEYQVNSVGEKDGWFKGYDQKGVLVYEYNFKNNLWDGINKEYTTVYGQREIAKMETYKAGVLNGPTKYYGKNGIVVKDGNFLDGEKNGKWIETNPYSNYDIEPSMKVGCEYIKLVSHYENGKTGGEPDGESREFYYPCNKLRSVLTRKAGKRIGKAIWYYPNGAIEAEEEYDNDGQLIYTNRLYPNGKTKEYSGLRNGVEVFEQYDKTGGTTRNMDNWVIQQERSVQEKKFLHQGDSLFNLQDYDGAKRFYEASGKAGSGNQNSIGYVKMNVMGMCEKAKERWENDHRLDLVFREFVYFKRAELPKLGLPFQNYVDTTLLNILTKSILQNKENTVKLIDDPNNKYILGSTLLTKVQKQIEDQEKLLAEIEQFKDVEDGVQKLYADGTFSGAKKKLIQQARPVLDGYFAEYKLADDREEKKGLTERIANALSVLKGMSDDTCSQFVKQLKKVSDPNEIRNVLGI